MVRAWAATLSETADLDVPTVVVWLGLGGTIHFEKTPATLEPPPAGTTSLAFDVEGRNFKALHVTFSAPIARSEFEQWMKATADGNPATYRYQMPGGPFSTVVKATYEGDKLSKVTMRREAPV